MFYIIVYPGSDISKISVVGMQVNMRCKLDDYKRASQKEFNERGEAVKYAKSLCELHGKQFMSREEADDFLD